MRSAPDTWTAPRSPETPDAAGDEEALASRSIELPWMEIDDMRSSRHRISVLEVFSAVLLIAFLAALLVALPLLVFQAL